MDAAIARTPASNDSMPASVIMDIHKIGRNSKVWIDPDKFRLERFLTGGATDATSAPVLFTLKFEKRTRELVGFQDCANQGID